MILDLDKTFRPFPSEECINYKSFTFTGGEPHIQILDIPEKESHVTISCRIQSFNDLGLLLMAVDALKRLDIANIHLILPYFPGARQDRVIQKGEPLSVKVYADIINAQKFDSVTVYDPHSDVTPALIDRCKVVSNHKFIQKVLDRINIPNCLPVAPDSGALKKVYDLATFIGFDDVLQCSKHRDVKTMNITDFNVPVENLNRKSCLVVDDICDGGRTFIGLAQELKRKNAGDLYLAVSHGIFSYGFDELLKYYKHIYTTDSFSTIVDLPDGVNQIKLSEVL